MAAPRKVLLLEFNEITRTVIDPMIAKGKLPNMARLFAEGTTAAPESVDTPPHLDPWVTWVTLHTGVDRNVHGATVLGQDDDTIKAKRSWDYAIEAGRSVGVFGSISAFPPNPVPGFMVPGPFAPSNATFPHYLEPIQRLNRKYTQVHHKNESAGSPFDTVKLGFELLSLGLKPTTCMEILGQLALEKAQPHMHWKRVTLQPLVNYDFFELLYKRYQPDFSTWHTNHAAHFMHHYWRAYDDSKFLVRAPEEEKRKYGAAVEYGYEVCDRLLGRFMKLVSEDTVLVLATSMGQQPYVKDAFPEGRVVVRFKDIKRVLELCGAEGVTEVVPTMVPQWNVKVPDAQKRAQLVQRLTTSTMVNGAKPNAFHIEVTGEILTVTPSGIARNTGDIRYFFPDSPLASPGGYPLDELFVSDAPTPKEGMHHPTGLLVFHGKGIERGRFIADTTNLDVLPTLLALQGIQAPAFLKGRVLSEAWGERDASRAGGKGEVRANA